MFGGKRITTRADKFFSAMVGCYQDNDAAQMNLAPDVLQQIDDARRNTNSRDIVAAFTLDSAGEKEFIHRTRDGYFFCLSGIVADGDFPATLSPSFQIELMDRTQPPAFTDGAPAQAGTGAAPVVPLVGSLAAYLAEPFDIMRMLPDGCAVRVTMKRHPLDTETRAASLVLTGWEIARSW